MTNLFTRPTTPKPANILLVDDEPRNLEVLENILAGDSHRLIKAANGEQALVELLRDEFAVLVLDIQMPGMSGLELANLIKEREKTQHIPIIFLTALYDDESRMLESYGVGAVDYLTKPVNPAVLRSKVGVFVDLFRKTQALQVSNNKLAREVAQREAAETRLRDANDELEARVKARTAALEAAHAETQRMARAKDEFLAALSHELRTPLNPVLLLASDAAQDMTLPAEVRSQFATIRKNVELEARLIDDLLDLTRITRGKLVLTPETIDVHAVLSDAISTIRDEAGTKKITLEVDAKARPGTVIADAVRLQQVFWNVLKNAVKFTPKGGKITISTFADAASQRVFVRVKDTGIGLTPEELGTVFEAFAQGEHATNGVSHAFGGLGLGLAISKNLMVFQKGGLHAESAGRNCGATFTVELRSAPVAAAPAPLLRLPAPAARASGPSREIRRILLVEDHEATRRTLAAMLQLRQYEVSSASSVAEARELAARESFDVLVSDIGLPDGTGFELMAEMKRDYGLSGIALTGYGMEEDIGQSRDAGFALHLTKPIVIQSLDSALEQLAG